MIDAAGGSLPRPELNQAAGTEMGVVPPSELYFKVRLRYAEALLQYFDTRAAVQTALDEMLAILLLVPGVSVTIYLRSRVPALHLRLGQDQEAYDFMTYCVTVPANKIVNEAPPLYDTKGTDALKSIDRWVPYHSSKETHLSQTIMVLLIKIRLMFSLRRLAEVSRTLRHVRKPDNQTPKEAVDEIPKEIIDKVAYDTTDHTGWLPNEIIDNIRKQFAQDGISNALTSPAIINGSDAVTSLSMETMKHQISVLFDAVHRTNEHFWLALWQFDSAAPSELPDGAPSDTQALVNATHAAWKETPQAMEVLATRYKKFPRHVHGPWPLRSHRRAGAAGPSSGGPGEPAA